MQAIFARVRPQEEIHRARLHCTYRILDPTGFGDNDDRREAGATSVLGQPLDGAALVPQLSRHDGGVVEPPAESRSGTSALLGIVLSGFDARESRRDPTSDLVHEIDGLVDQQYAQLVDDRAPKVAVPIQTRQSGWREASPRFRYRPIAPSS